MRYLVIFLLTTFCFSCKTDNATSTAKVSDEFVNAEKAYNDSPDEATANVYLDQIVKRIGSSKGNQTDIVNLSTKGLKVSEAMNFAPKTRNFLFNLIKEDYKNTETPKRIMGLATQMETLKRSQTANILYKSLIDNFSTSEESRMATEKIDPIVSNLDNYLVNIGEEIFKGDVNKFGINRNAALKYVDACEAYALGFPNNEKTASYLFRAAEIAKSIQTYPKVLGLYDWIIGKYPNYEKAATTLFLKGFVLENDLKNDEQAEKVYREFMDKYPEHDLIDDVKFLLDNIGKSDEEIRQLIEDKQAENAAESN